MANLLKEVNYLRYFYTSDDASKDKDSLKNAAFDQYVAKTSMLFAIPLGFQAWQISLVNVAAKADLYNRVRLFKSVAMTSACCLGLWEYSNLRKKMTFYDRFYPEPTELQRKLTQEALMFKQKAYVQETIEERLAKLQDPEKALKYA